jgi:hypothetical protein
VSDHNLDRINATVRECLSYCYSRENVLIAMAEYLAVLKTSGTWHDTELSLVRATVTRVLRQLDDGIDTGEPD